MYYIVVPYGIYCTIRNILLHRMYYIVVPIDKYYIYIYILHRYNIRAKSAWHTRVPRGYQIKTKISNFGYLHILSAHILLPELIHNPEAGTLCPDVISM